MATLYLSKKISLELAKDFIKSFSTEESGIGYVFFGKPNSYIGGIEEITENLLTENEIWNTMFAAKRILGTNLNLALKVNPWTIGEYVKYDNNLTSFENTYVTTEQGSIISVYKCLNNNYDYINSAISASNTAPIGDYTINNGIVDSGLDGYIWKYMFSIDRNDFADFITTTHIPVPDSIKESFNTSNQNLIEGAIYSVVMTNVGSAYQSSVQIVSPPGTDYLAATNQITLVSVSNVAVNMSVTGNGVPSGTYVTAVDNGLSQITLSQSTTSNGNTLYFDTRVVFEGDGKNALATANVHPTGSIDKIIMSTYGSDYSTANVLIYGLGSGATARAILSPKFGHGFNPAKELSANSVIISVNLSEYETSTNNEIRQVGIVKSPYKYGSSVALTSNEASLNVDQFYTITLTTGSSYTLDEYVYQGDSAATANFSGYVYDQDESSIKLTGVKGTFTLGTPVIGDSSSVSRAAIDIQYPFFEKNTGDILYVENRDPIVRNPGQNENFKFVFRF